LIRQTSHRVYEGATEIFIYSNDFQNLFAATVAAMDQLHLNIQDARIIVTEGGHALNTYTVLTDNNAPLSENPDLMDEIKNRLIEELDDPDDYPDIIQRRVPRQMKLFATPTKVNISNDAIAQQTVIEVMTPDRPGLLARIGGIFSSHNLSVRKARIASIGERVEDFFYITDAEGLPISDPDLCLNLQQEICQQLDESLQLDNH
jgi:[protein-PII] uridylyltransferase